MILLLLIIGCLWREAVTEDLVSPCPSIFHYEPQKESDKWYGVLQASTDESLSGLWITVKLDSKAELLGNWFGETYSTDNQEFRMTNPDYVLEAGPPVSIRFFVKYNKNLHVPRLQTIRINGKTVCSENRKDAKPTGPKLHISKTRPSKQPSVGGGLSYEPTGTSGTNEDITTIHKPSTSHGTGSSSTFDEHSPSDGSNVYRPSTSNTNIYDLNKPSVGSDTYDVNRPSSGLDNADKLYGGSDRTKPENTYNRPSSSDDYNRPSSSDNYNIPSSDNYKNPVGQLSNPNDVNANTNIENTRPSPRPSPRPSDNNNPDRTTSKGKDSDEDFFQGDFNINKPSDSRPNDRPSGPDTSKSVVCGTVASRPRPLITNGQDTVPGEWPWHTAIYHTKGIQLVYICGASLISDKYVLTAAHCVSRSHSNKVVDSDSILVYFGKYNLKTFGPETQDRDISDIYIHPEYNYTTFYNDIALIKLSRPVEITDYVRPCCLWEGDTNLDNVVEKEGTVIGWGFDENKKISEKLMQAKMPVVSTIKCIYSNRDFFARFTSDKNFCAGFLNGTSVCNGDSGGSMVFPRSGSRGQSKIWQIRGIVSVGVALQSEGVCDTSQYVIFTDVAKYLGWIKQIIRS